MMLRGRCMGQTLEPSYGSNKKMKPLLAGISNPSSRGSILEKICRKLGTFYFFVKIFVNFGK